MAITKKELPCYFKPCPFGYSELGLSDFAPWLEMFRILHSDTIKSCGLGASILNQGEGLTAEVFELFADFDGALNEQRGEERKRRQRR